MKAVILAAGRGSRLGQYTEKKPKGLLELAGKTILEIQIECLRSAGITDISIVKGYKGEEIKFTDVKYYWNEDYDNTNMVVSLMKAVIEFTDDIIISYADIIYEKRLLEQLINSKSEAAILVDLEWKKYWHMRYGTSSYDLESLIIDSLGNIIEIGRPDVTENNMMSRYIGLLKFSKNNLNHIKSIVLEAEKLYCDTPWKHSRKPYKKAYMTDLLQALIDVGIELKAEQVVNGWLEFDSESDYENVLTWLSNGSINVLFGNDIGSFQKLIGQEKNMQC